MLVSRFDPFKEFANMQKMFNGFPNIEEENTINSYTPLVNTREGESAYHIDIDLPGVSKENINLDVNDSTLTITGERAYKNEIKEKDYYKVETSFGKFQRAFNLPEDTDIENISASSNDGVLEIVIPKLEKTQTKKKINIE